MAVQVALTPAGNVSATDAPTAFDGPALLTTIVYVVVVPGTAVATPSVFVIERSVDAVSVSVSLALSFDESKSVELAGVVIVAVLTRLPVAAAEMFAVTV